MKSTITKTTDTTKTLKVILTSETLEKTRKETLDKLRPRVKAAGFRPGKAPDHIVERELGANAIQAEVLEEAINHSYLHTLSEHEIVPVAHPDIQVDKYVPYTELEYSATVEVMPEIKVMDYRKLKLKKPEIKVEDKEIDEVIEDLRRRMASKNASDQPAEMGDEVTFDFDGTKDGQPVEGASAQGHKLVLGSKTFIPGFEEELVGLKAGDEKEFDIVFPKDYHSAELAGQKVTFKVKVQEVGKLVLPEVNAEFIASISPFKTVEELRADIESQLKASKEGQERRQFEEKVLEEIVAGSKIKVPSKLVANQADRLRRELEDRLSGSGMDIEKYLQMSNQSSEQLEKELQTSAERRVSIAMVLSQIAKDEDIKVSDEEVDEELARLRQNYQDPQMQAELDKLNVRDEIHNYLLADKTVAKITSSL